MSVWNWIEQKENRAQKKEYMALEIIALLPSALRANSCNFWKIRNLLEKQQLLEIVENKLNLLPLELLLQSYFQDAMGLELDTSIGLNIWHWDS